MKFTRLVSPNFFKIIFFLILILSTFLIPREGLICPNNSDNDHNCIKTKAYGLGYPVFYGQTFDHFPGEIQFNFINFIINVIIYYLISCVIVQILYFVFKIRQK